MSIGIDIGKYSVKIVELSSTNNQVKVKKIGSLNTFADINKFNLENISKSQLEGCVQELTKQLNINARKARTVVSSISGSVVDIREISTLDMSDEELSVSLELEAKKHIPLDGTDAIIDYHHLGNNTTEIDKINILLVSTTKNVIREHARLIKKSGFKPDIFDTDSIAIANTYKFNHGLSPKGADVILNIGNSTTSLIVWGENCPFFTRNIEISGDYFTNAMMRELSLDYQTAENLKFEKGINAFIEKNGENPEESLESNVSISIEKKTCFNEFCEDIKRTLRFYMKNNSHAFFNNFYITGGSSNIPGINEFIASVLDVKVLTFDPLQKISNDIQIDNPNQYSAAIGLALRGLDIE